MRPSTFAEQVARNLAAGKIQLAERRARREIWNRAAEAAQAAEALDTLPPQDPFEAEAAAEVEALLNEP